MLRVKGPNRELARYITARYLLEDEAWHCLLEADEPLSVTEMVAPPHGFRAPAGEQKLRRLLESSWRFRYSPASDKFSLSAWEQLEGGYVDRVSLLLERSGLPLREVTIGRLLARHAELQSDAKRPLLQHMLRGTDRFLPIGDRWALTRWLAGPGHDSVLEHLTEVSEWRDLPPEGSAWSEVARALLRGAGAGVSIQHLWWELRYSGARVSEIDVAGWALTDSATVWLGTRHCVALSVAKQALEWWRTAPDDHLCALSTRLATREVELKSPEAMAQEIGGKAVRHALTLLRDKPLTEDELGEQLLRERVTRALEELPEPLHTDPTVVEHAVSVACHSLTSRLSQGRYILVLPGQRLLLVPPQAVADFAARLRDGTTGLRTEEFLASVSWPSPIAEDAAAVGDQLAHALKHQGLELTAGYWHRPRAEIVKLCREKRSAIQDRLERQGPAAVTDLLTEFMGCQAACPEPIRQLVGQVLEEELRRHPGVFWRLNSGKWWLCPSVLLTDERLAQYSMSPRSQGQAVREICGIVFGVRPDELTDEEMLELGRALERAVCPPGSQAEPALEEGRYEGPVEVSDPVKAVLPARYGEVSLTEDMLRRRYLLLSEQMLRLLGAYASPGATAEVQLVVEGRYGISAKVDMARREMKGSEVFSWLQESGAGAGDRVRLYAPAPPETELRMALIQPRRDGDQGGRGGEHRTRIALRDAIYGVLSNHGSVMTSSRIAEAIAQDLGRPARPEGVQATLSAEPHLFARFGRSLWGLAEWQDEWDGYVDPQSILMRIEEEDMVVDLLTREGRPLSVDELAREIAARFGVRAETIRQVTFLNAGDPRILRSGDMVRLSGWLSRPEGSSRRVLGRWLRPIQTDPGLRERVDRWHRSNWGTPLSEVEQWYDPTPHGTGGDA